MAVSAALEYWLDIPEETTGVEFKRLDGDRVVAKVIETVVAMANTDGGTIVLGIDDPEKTKFAREDRLFGVEEDLDIYDEIRRKTAHIQPGLSLNWPPQQLVFDRAGEQRHVALLKVEKSTQYLHQYEGHAYIRLNKGNKRLTAQECVQYAYAKGFEHADKELVDVAFELLETATYQIWAAARNISNRPIAQALLATGLAKRNASGVVQPTRAAVMLFAEFPSLLLDSKCAIRIFVYEGTVERFKEVPNLLQTPITIDAPTIELIRRAHETTLNLLHTGVRVPSGFITTYALPERAIKEAITNAVIHRDYHTKRDIEIRVFEDRIEIESPGLLPYNITRANIGRVRAEGYRNDLLVKHLREFPSPPNLDRNEGVPAMREAMAAGNLYPPLFFIPDSRAAIVLVLWNEERASEWEKLENYLTRTPFVTNSEARRVTDIVQSQDMTRRFNQWVKQGLLVRVPTDINVKKNVKYKLANGPANHVLSTSEKNNKLDNV